MMGPAYGTRSAGMNTIIGKSLARTLRIFPLFGSLAGRIEIDPTATGAGIVRPAREFTVRNGAGEGMGQRLSPQNLEAAASAANQTGHEAGMAQAPLQPSILLASLGGSVFSKTGLITKLNSEDIR